MLSIVPLAPVSEGRRPCKVVSDTFEVLFLVNLTRWWKLNSYIRILSFITEN